MIYIRADGNTQIGIGHVMRCLSIAAAYRESGGDPIFIMADNNMKPLLDNQGFSAICLDSKWDDLDLEISKMEHLVIEKRVKKLLVDSYYVTPKYLRRLNELTCLVYMDDLNAFTYPCRELINYNIYADRFDYPSHYPNTQLLIGPKYAPLRAEFQNLPIRQIRGQAKSVLISTGGSDPQNIACKLAKLTKEHPVLSSLHYHIVVGKFYSHLAELNCLSNEADNITMHQDIDFISKLMLDCDIAVSAGGSTLYELCACGTPTVVFAMADNQLPAITAFGGEFMLDAGDYRADAEACLAGIIDGIAKLAADSDLRQMLSQKCRKLVDGLGASRIADSLMK